MINNSYCEIISIIKYYQKQNDSINTNTKFSVVVNTWSNSYIALSEYDKALFICGLLESISQPFKYKRLIIQVEKEGRIVLFNSFFELQEFYISDLIGKDNDSDIYIEYPLLIDFFDANNNLILTEKTIYHLGGKFPFSDNYELIFQLGGINYDILIDSIVNKYGVAIIREMLVLPDSSDNIHNCFSFRRLLLFLSKLFR